ncbi:endonuclease NucS domain-containing protein [Grimontia sp. SpTr1]|uniref:endonuclease NucS domain-containing protein n=1 Tax=Grimontia sp. SpTr1 TaxID=2995319 RepID=UPI00248D28C7|nr:endonuclease NucS domain-containing protein [Grimontia sp. SpTr1]
MNENKLRDLLVGNIDLLCSGLTVIKKEKYIPNHLGTRGFIDIYARDHDGKHVLIELKRTKAATREAIHELIKYVEGVKNYLGANDDEIKVIIASTDWDELLVPFSRFVKDSSISVTGLKIDLCESNGIINVSLVNPLPVNKGRSISPCFEIFWYRNSKSLSKGINSIKRICKNSNIDDFIIATFELKKPEIPKPQLTRQSMLSYTIGIGEGNIRLSLCKYVVIFSLQSKSERYWLEFIKENLEEEQYQYVLDRVEGINDESKKTLFLQNQALGNINGFFFDDAEPGYGAKVDDLIEKDCSITIERFGMFSRNDLLSDDTIISELRSENGSSGHKLSMEIVVEDKSELESLKSRVKLALYDNEIWLNHFNRIISEIESDYPISHVKARIFNPGNGVFTLYNYLKYDNNLGFAPHYEFQVNQNGNVVRTYYGVLKGSKPLISFYELLVKYYDGKVSYLLSSGMSGSKESRHIDILEDLGLSYRNYRMDIDEGIARNHIYDNERWRGCDNTHPHSHLNVYLNENVDFYINLFRVIQSYEGDSFFKINIQEPSVDCHLVIERSDVENKSFGKIIDRLNHFSANKELALKYCSKLEITFDGYGYDNRELHQIAEVREYVVQLFQHIPFLFYFLKKDGFYHSFRVFLLCVATTRSYEVNGEPMVEFDFEKFDILIRAQFIGLNELTDRFEISLEENKRISEEVISSIKEVFSELSE